MRKKLFFTFVWMLSMSLPHAQNNNTFTAELQQATVYLQGATLTHIAKANLKTGAQEITIDGISPEIDLNSLEVRADHTSTLISSVEFSTDYMTVKKEASRLKQLRDSLGIYKKQLKTVQNSLSVNNKLLKTLSDGITQNTQQKDKILSATELTAALDLYKAKAPAIQKNIDDDKELENKLNSKINRIQAQIRQDESKERQRSGILRIALTTPVAVGGEEIHISYYTTKASWSPCYDIRVTSTSKPVTLQAKAQVRQMTGLDWTQVQLMLSNARPNLTNTAPLFNAWFLRFRNPQTKTTARNALYSNTLTYSAEKKTALKEKETVEYDEVSDAEYSEESSTPSTLYLLNGYYISQKEFESIDPSFIESMEVMEPENAVKTYGKNATIYILKTKTMDDYVELNESEIDIFYRISLPYTIPGNGKAQLIDLKQYDIQTEYYYYAAPKLSETCYLMAKLSDWEKYNLLPGSATINYNGTYVGKTHLPSGTTEKSLTLTLANESRISVKREKRTEFSSSKSIGSNTTATRSHRITVKNNLGKSVPIIIKEQYPISTQKEIEVKLTEHTPEASQNNSGLGVLTWNLKLEPGESRTFDVTYSVKYPKERTLDLE